MLSNSCKYRVNSNLFVRLFHPPLFIMTHQKISNPSQLLSVPTITVGRVQTSYNKVKNKKTMREFYSTFQKHFLKTQQMAKGAAPPNI